MQEIKRLDNTSDALFVIGDRKTKPPPHNLNSVKCPRCDSANTKFCYYNNYNLSQPRHFCKSCRRYWTKGGVLRNVPVGGGCRRTTKRSKAKPKPGSDSDLHSKSKVKSNSNSNFNSDSNSNSNSQSSSQNSGLTVTTTTAVTTTTTAVLESSPASPSTLVSYKNHRLHVSCSQPSFDPLPVDIFPEIGTFTNLMTSATDSSALGFNLADYKSNLDNMNSNQHCDVNNVMDPTVEIELSRWENRTTEVEFPAVDWQPTDHDGVFDLTANVDQSYWSQTQWSDHEVNDNNPLNYLR